MPAKKAIRPSRLRCRNTEAKYRDAYVLVYPDRIRLYRRGGDNVDPIDIEVFVNIDKAKNDLLTGQVYETVSGSVILERGTSRKRNPSYGLRPNDNPLRIYPKVKHGIGAVVSDANLIRAFQRVLAS